MTTLVIFLKEQGIVTEKGYEYLSVFAYFPFEIGDSHGNRTCYSHIGQHSSCCYEYAVECTEATPTEYLALKRELNDIGYKLQVI